MISGDGLAGPARPFRIACGTYRQREPLPIVDHSVAVVKMDHEAWAKRLGELVLDGFVMKGYDSGAPSKPQRFEEGLIWPNPQQEMAAVARAFLMCCKENGTPVLYWEGAGWFRYNGTRYVHYTHEEFEHLLYRFFGPLHYTKIDGRNQKKKLVAFNPDSTFLKRCRESIRAQAIKKNLVHDSWLDGRKDRVIPLQNGLLRVEDRVLLEHTPLFFNTYCLAFNYDEHAASPDRWSRFLDEVWPEDPASHALLQEWFGYVLSGRTDLQKMMMLIGVSRSGKGTIARLLREMVSPEAYVGLSSRDIGGDFGMESLPGKTLAVFSDDRMTVRGNDVVETLLRITGEDIVSVNQKFEKHWIGQISARLMFISNEVPTFPDASQAINNRILPLYMPVSFVGREDPGLLWELGLELPGIFNWALDGLARLSANGGTFAEARSAEHVRKLLRTGASPLAEFVEEECTLAPDAKVEKNKLYAEWKHWAEANGRSAGSSADFGKKLFAAYGTRIESCRIGSQGSQRPGYRGIELQSRGGEWVNGVRRA